MEPHRAPVSKATVVVAGRPREGAEHPRVPEVCCLSGRADVVRRLFCIDLSRADGARHHHRLCTREEGGHQYIKQNLGTGGGGVMSSE